VLQALDNFSILEKKLSSSTSFDFSIVYIPDRPINASISSFYSLIYPILAYHPYNFTIEHIYRLLHKFPDLYKQSKGVPSDLDKFSSPEELFSTRSNEISEDYLNSWN
jgi:hypothetical protein